MTPEARHHRAELAATLALLQEWGVDEFLYDAPQDRFAEGGADALLTESLRGVRDSALERREPSRAQVLPERAPEGQQPAREGRRATVAPQVSPSAAEPLSDIAFLARTATHRLEPIYVHNAPVLVIGDVPDAEEDRTGQLFSGDSGALLDRMLASIGVQRADFSLVSAVPWRPPGGRPLSLEERRACLPLLHQVIQTAQPKRIVTLGLTPLRMLCGESATLARMRGKWVDVTIPQISAPIALLPMSHPLQLKAGASVRRKAWEDLLSLRVFLEKEATD